MKQQILIISALFLTLFSACETRETGNIKDVTQSEIYQDLSFISDGSATKARATFSFAGVRGTTLKLTNPSKVLFNGQPLEEKTGQYSGTYYEKTFDTVLSDGNFTFTDTKGKTYTNKVELPAIDFKVLQLTINRTAVTNLPVVNGAKVGESSVELEISYQDKQGFQRKYMSVLAQKKDEESAYFDAKTRSIVIEPVIWQSIKAAQVKIKITSKASADLQQGTSIGGKINSEYGGKTVSIILSGKSAATISAIIPKSNTNTRSANTVATTNTNSTADLANIAADSATKKPLAKKRIIQK